MDNRSAEAQILPSAQVMRRGLQAFIIFSGLGAMLGLVWKRPIGFEDLLRDLQWPFLLGLLPLLAVDFILGGWRYALFFDGKILPRISLWQCMRSNWANIFLGAVTPFQTGGGPAQIYMLWRQGAKLSEVMLISIVNLAATLIFFMTSTIAAAALLPTDLFGENFTTLLHFSFLIIGGIVASLLGLLLFPQTMLGLLRRLLYLLRLRSQAFSAMRERVLQTLTQETLRFREAFRLILRQRKWLLLVTVLATQVLFANKYLMGYVIVRALGQEAPFAIFIGLQVIQLFMIYYAPTPGASGVAELSSVWLMSKLLPPQMLLIYALLWRFVTTMVGAMIGGVVLLREIKQFGRIENTNGPAALTPLAQTLVRPRSFEAEF